MGGKAETVERGMIRLSWSVREEGSELVKGESSGDWRREGCGRWQLWVLDNNRHAIRLA